MDKVKNFRDLGGIPAKDGRRVKGGLFFRSAFLDEATEEDLSYLKSLGLKYIFDYRDMDEVNKDNDIKYKKIGARHMHYPNNIIKGKVYKLQNRGLSRVFIRITPEDVMEFYRYLPFGNTGYRIMTETLAEGGAPFLQHCAAGKDRAGLGSALLLAILGVSYDEIVKDYLASLENRDYVVEKMIGNIPLFIRKHLCRLYEPLFIVDKDYIDAAKNAVIEKYGTFEKYLLLEYGLTDEKINQIRDMYTE